MSARTRSRILAGALLASVLAIQTSGALAEQADTIYIKANVVTLDLGASATAIAIKGETILGVGSDSEMLSAFRGAGTSVVRLDGATVLPGFIDAHSHLLGYASYTDATYWLDVSSINDYFKPLPGDARCTDPSDPQKCFIPATTHEEVLRRIKKAAVGAKAVYAFNYDPARLGHGPTCTGPQTNVGFDCPNFEQGHARADLDAISTRIPIFVASQSGHISYVNSKALELLNICGTEFAGENCYSAVYNPRAELALAQNGQLNEDLSLHAESVIEGKIIKADPVAAIAGVNRAADIYADHGYTLAQEGAAGTSEVDLYLATLALRPHFPLSIALMMFNASPNFNKTIAEANKAKQMIAKFPDLFVSGLKNFADGSPQGFTANLTTTYKKTYPPFNAPVFPSPYTGQPDSERYQMRKNAILAHRAGYPLMIHNNGDLATLDTVNALTNAHAAEPSSFRDIVLHAPFLNTNTLGKIAAIDDPISFLITNLYFWGLPLCQQILGSDFTTRRYQTYPAGDALKAGLDVTFHSDAPVSPPYPLFEIYIAKTRKSQQPAWYPNVDTTSCPVIRDPQQALTIRQGIKAVTINAAKQYGLEKQLGSIKAGKQADLVFLSADPLSMEKDPEQLRTIRTLGTVHRGHFRPNPHANETPIWPE